MDIRAIAALYYFDLGSDVYPEFARWAVALDLFIRLPGELIHNYEALVPTNPVLILIRPPTRLRVRLLILTTYH